MNQEPFSRTSRARMRPSWIISALRAVLAAALVFTLIGSLLPSGLGLSAAAASSSLSKAQADLVEARKELKALQASLDKLAKQQVDAENDLEDTLIRIDEVRADIAATQEDLAGLRVQLAGRLTQIYKSRGSGALDALSAVLSGDDTSIGAIMERLSVVSRIAESDNELIASVLDRARDLDELEADLSKQQAAEQKKNAKWEASIDKTLQSLEKAKDDYNRLRTRVATLEEEARKREEEARRAKEAQQAAAAAAARDKKTPASTPSPAKTTARIGAAWVFPVAGPNSFGSTFGAPRSGGRTHKGTDIFTARNTPLVAVEDGVISSTNPYDRGLGGITVHMKNSRGTTYYYAHLESIKSGIRAGVRVKAGQVIGYAGNTGNARTTPVHLHFEIRPNGVAVDPYPTLLKYR